MFITDHSHLWEKGSGNYYVDFAGFEFTRGQEIDNWITDPEIDIHYPAPPERLACHMREGNFE